MTNDSLNYCSCPKIPGGIIEVKFKKQIPYCCKCKGAVISQHQQAPSQEVVTDALSNFYDIWCNIHGGKMTPASMLALILDTKEMILAGGGVPTAHSGQVDNPPPLTEHQKAVEEAAGMAIDWNLANKMGVRNSNQPSEISVPTDDQLVNGMAHAYLGTISAKSLPSIYKPGLLAALQFIRPYLRTTEPVSLAFCANAALQADSLLDGDEPVTDTYRTIAKAVLDEAGVPYV